MDGRLPGERNSLPFFGLKKMESRAANIPKGCSIEDYWAAIKNIYLVAGENNLSKILIQRKQWVTDDTGRKIEERRNIKVAIEWTKIRVAEAASHQRYLVLEIVKRLCV